MARQGRGNKRSRADEEKHALLSQLVEIARSIGTEVREERLVREVGYSVRSGLCRVDGREVLFLDSNAAVSERIDALLDFLASRDLDELYIEPQIREMIGGRSADDEDPSGHPSPR